MLLDAGSTTVRLSEHFPVDRRLTVMTHSVTIALRLAAQPELEVHMLPGRVRRTTLAAVGTETVAALDQIRADPGRWLRLIPAKLGYTFDGFRQLD